MKTFSYPIPQGTRPIAKGTLIMTRANTRTATSARRLAATAFSALPAALLAFGLTSPALAATADQPEAEPNDTAATATTLQLNGTGSFSGTLDNTVEETDKGTTVVPDTDTFEFTLPKGSIVHLSLHAETGDYTYSSPKLEIQREDGTYYASDYVYYNRVLGEAVIDRDYYLGSGTYRMTLVDRDARQHVSYNATFEVDQWEDFAEPNNNIKQATLVSSGAVIRGMIGDGFKSDSDFFHIPGNAGEKWYVTIRNLDIAYGISLHAYDDKANALGLFAKKKTSVRVGTGKTLTRAITLSADDTYICVENGYAGRYKLSFTRKPDKAKKVKIVKKGSRSLKVSWKAQSDASGYQVFRSTRKGGGYHLVKTVKSAGKHSFVDKSRSRGITYYYKVRAINKVNGYTCKGGLSKAVGKRR